MSEKKVNQVIVNGEELINLRNDTVTPQTLVKDETATNKEGAKIVGELDPVSHNEAYLIDDPEGDIDDSDYIPFNDVSDEEEPKKKILFSSIVDKLKTIFVSKSWGHVNVNLSSDSLEIKDEEVDVEQANNNITTTHYPSTDSILDKNGKSITRFQSQIDADGKIRATMYVRNFNTSGQSLGVNQISAGMDKSGNSFYEVTNHNKFREAIKTVDQLGTDIPSNADLNTYKTAGTYRVPSDAIGATISNLPLALCGKVVVFNNGNGGFEQFYFPNHNPKIYVRTWWNNAWSSWREIGEGGGDGKDHTYEKGTEIPSTADLNDYTTEGVYYVQNVTIAESIGNIPIAKAGKLIVMARDTGVRRFQIYIGSKDDIYMRDMDNNREFSLWRNISKPHTYELGTDIPTNSDLNDYIVAGTYRISSDTVASSLSNCPTTIGGKLLVLYQSHQSNLTIAIQIYIETTANKIYKRRYNSDVTPNWNDWTSIASTDDLIPHTYEDGIAIPANSDLNDYKTAGVYTTTNDTIASSIANIPKPNTGKLIVSYSAPSHNYIQQIYIVAYNNAIYTRFYDNWNLIWKEWKQLASTDDISPSTVGDGYAVATVSGSAITATISGFKLRAGVIVGLRFTQAVNVDCTLNINSTGAKPVLLWGNAVSYGYPIPFGLNTFIYDGTNYRIIAHDSSPFIGNQSVIADTSGSIVLDWGYGVNRAQIKYNLSNDKLVWNYYKNSAWRGDRTLIEEIESGIIKLHRETTTADDLPVGLEASIKDTTTGKTYAMRIIRAYQDHQATPYGLNLLFGGGGNTIIGSGESDSAFYDVMSAEQKVAENLYLLGDGGVILESNANAIADRKGFKIVDGKLIPVKAEVNTNNFGDLGSSSNKLANVFTYKINGVDTESHTYVGTCETAGANKDKVATVDSNFRLVKGVSVAIKFTNVNTYSNATASPITLNVNSTGAKNIWYGGTHSGAGNTGTNTTAYGRANYINYYVYDGTYWVWQSSSADNDGNNRKSFYGTCSTEAGTSAKVVTLSDTNGWELRAGTIVGVKFSNSNTASNVTLNVNSSGAKSIYYNTGTYTGTSNAVCGVANRTNFYMYNGSQWVFLNNGLVETDTFTSARSDTAGGTSAKVATCNNYALLTKSHLHIIMTYSNTAKSALTLNVNGKGAKPIYINGSASSASNYTLPAGSYLIYYNGTNYYFRTDGKITCAGTVIV